MLEDDGYIFSNDFIKKMKRLEKMIFPSSLFLDSNYLYSIRNMKEIRITSSSKNIADKAFFGLYSLEKVFISKSVISIGKSCFEKSTNLEEVIFESPSNIVSIGESAFSGCKSLKKITIPPLCKSIENFTFYGCSSLEKININSNILSIGDFSFCECIKLSCVSFELPSLLKEIRFRSFSDCPSLKNIYIPYSVTSIKNPFINCNNLTIYVPQSLKDSFKAFEENRPTIYY